MGDEIRRCRHRPLLLLRRTAKGLARRGYSYDEIDAVAAYCLELDASFFIPFEAI